MYINPSEKTQLFTEIMNSLRQLLSSDRGTVFLVNHHEKLLVSCVHSGEEGPLEIRIHGIVELQVMCVKLDYFEC